MSIARITILSCVLCAVPLFSGAEELTSTNYSLTPRIGMTVEATTLTSTNFTLIPHGNGAESGDTTSEEDEPEQGSRGRTVRTVPQFNTLPEVIAGTVFEDLFTEEGGAPHIAKKDEGAQSDVYEDGISDSERPPQASAEIQDKKKRNMKMTASLIGAWLSGHAGEFSALFEDRRARGALLVIVLISLLLIRNYTSFGKKYRPF